MWVVRFVLVAVLTIAAVGGCTFWGEKLPSAELDRKGQADGIPVYFSADAPMVVSQRLGAVTGFSCGSGALFATPSSGEPAALTSLRKSATAVGAKAVVNARCVRTRMLASYRTEEPGAGRSGACWPGFMCMGDAVR